MLLLLVLLSVCESMLSFHKVSGKTALAEESLAMWTLMLFVIFFHAVSNLLLCAWFPGSWLALPRQTLDTAPLFSPQEQYLNVESTPILTEDAQSWIWVEVGSSDTLRGGITKHPMWLTVLPALMRSQLSLSEPYLCAVLCSQDWLFSVILSESAYSQNFDLKPSAGFWWRNWSH